MCERQFGLCHYNATNKVSHLINANDDGGLFKRNKVICCTDTVSKGGSLLFGTVM